MTLHELRFINYTELIQNKNNSKYLEDKPRLENLNNIYIAYQNKKIVYVGSKNIQNGLEIAAEKLNGLICNDSVLIIRIEDKDTNLLLR